MSYLPLPESLAPARESTVSAHLSLQRLAVPRVVLNQKPKPSLSCMWFPARSLPTYISRFNRPDKEMNNSIPQRKCEAFRAHTH